MQFAGREGAGLRWFEVVGIDWPARVRVVFTTRVGGTSAGEFRGLNFGLGSGDDMDVVRANRKAVASALGLASTRYVVGGQVHGTSVAAVRASDAGRGADSRETVLKETDGMATAEPGPVLVTLAADCVPVALVDPARPAVAALHAGWRGTADGVAAAGVRRLRETFDSKPSDLLAVLGPAIEGTCYQVGSEVAARFADGSAPPDPAAPGKFRLDLHGALARSLVSAGVSRERILRSDFCTFCAPDLFYSWRRDGNRTGRQAMLAWIEL